MKACWPQQAGALQSAVGGGPTVTLRHFGTSNKRLRCPRWRGSLHFGCWFTPCRLAVKLSNGISDRTRTTETTLVEAILGKSHEEPLLDTPSFRETV